MSRHNGVAFQFTIELLERQPKKLFIRVMLLFRILKYSMKILPKWKLVIISLLSYFMASYFRCLCQYRNPQELASSFAASRFPRRPPLVYFFILMELILSGVLIFSFLLDIFKSSVWSFHMCYKPNREQGKPFNKFVNYILDSEILFSLALQVHRNMPLSEIYAALCSDFKK